MIESIDPRILKPHPLNSRTHTAEQLAQLKASIERFGFNGAIVIDEDDVILAGHGRAQAMIELGRPTIPCVRKADLSPLEKRAYVIADNQIALNSAWDEDILSAEVAALLDEGLDPVLVIVATCESEPQARILESRHCHQHAATIYNIHDPAKGARALPGTAA